MSILVNRATEMAASVGAKNPSCSFQKKKTEMAASKAA
jgi:hypothetical protein